MISIISPPILHQLSGPDQASTYASSTENISRLLEVATNYLRSYKEKPEQESGGLISHEEFESILSLESLHNVAWDKSCSDSAVVTTKGFQNSASTNVAVLEKWILDENGAGQVEDIVELSPIF
ncbi:hypothetical protein OIU85_003510 [Salix viminalis]|uniref:Uncharacterized protein n=1 Tax=Salix viminalis TaxID=40686 RepID=A0A9Q0T1H4_SALVM|nr:hypothetical protein OIU85_003510 [Salix viminalis]